MTVLIEDTWNAQDIINYCIVNDLEYKVLTVKELYKYPKFLDNIYFCNTDIVRHHLEVKNMLEVIPDTYSEKYKELFLRKIEKKKISDLLEKDFPIFIKPTKNDKSFDGQIIYSYDTFIGTLPKPDDYVYCSEVVNISSEYRFLIGNNKIYGYGHMIGKVYTKHFPQDFLEKLTKLVGESFECVDVGYIPDKKQWCVVEINPPFSLDDYKINLNGYMEFCIDSCKWIKNKIQ